MTDTPTDKKEVVATNMLDEARATADRLEKANAEMRLNIARLEELKTREVLGGRSQAGTEPEKPKEVSAKEYAQAALNGTIMK